jgi:hypothetical protein
MQKMLFLTGSEKRRKLQADMHLPQCTMIFCSAAATLSWARAVTIALLFPFLFGVPCRSWATEVAGYYEGTWAGLPAAQIRLGITETGSHYRLHVAVESRGLPRWFTKFRTDVTVEGELTAAGEAIPQRYDGVYDLRKRHARHVSLLFRATDQGLLVERGPDDTSTKPPLAEQYRRDVLDPLSALFMIRKHLEAAKADPFKLPIFDGARRFNVANVPARDPVTGLRLTHLTLEPIAGFHGESSDEGDPDSAPRPAEATFTADDTALPDSFRVNIAWFPFVVHLVKRCADFDSCQPPPD